LVISATRQAWQAPIAGIGQGNSAGPQIWAAVSLPMFDIMHSEGFYAHVISVISGQSQKLVGFAFVDDTDLCVHGPHITVQNVTSPCSTQSTNGKVSFERQVAHWFPPSVSGI